MCYLGKKQKQNIPGKGNSNCQGPGVGLVYAFLSFEQHPGGQHGSSSIKGENSAGCRQKMVAGQILVLFGYFKDFWL